MTSLRVVLVTPRFWPLAGELEFSAASLGSGLRELGVDVTVLTSRWGTTWPPWLMIHGVRVVRVPHAPRGGWGTFRYLTAVNRWLRRQRSEFDLVYVMGMRFDAYSTVSALRKAGIPVVLRCHDHGPGGDASWQQQSRWGSRVKMLCHSADAIVVTNAPAKQELLALNYSPTRLIEIPLGVGSGEPRSADRRFRARSILADVNRDLAAAEYAPVALFGGSLDEVAEFARFLEEWQEIASRWPSSKLWVIGDGTTRERIIDRLSDLDLRYNVVLPGAFEDWSDLFQAADLFVWPFPQGGRQLLLEAMAAGLPVVARESSDLRGMIEHGQHGLLVPAGQAGAWMAAIGQIWESPQRAAEMGAAASKWVAARFSRRHMAEAHVALFDRLLADVGNP